MPEQLEGAQLGTQSFLSNEADETSNEHVSEMSNFRWYIYLNKEIRKMPQRTHYYPASTL